MTLRMLRVIMLLAFVGNMPVSTLVDASAHEPQQTRQQALDSAVTDWHKNVDAFLHDADMLLDTINEVYHTPGWSEMSQIIEAFSPLQTRAGQKEAVRQTRAALEVWSYKWTTSGLEFLREYLSLTVWSHTLEERRVSLLDTWEELAREDAALQAASSPQPSSPDSHGAAPAQARMAREVAHRAHLSLYGLNALELYEKRAP